MNLSPAALDPQPRETALALPAICYADPAFESIDRDAVLARSWQLVAHAAQVARPGDIALAQIADVPLLIVRGADGVLRALHNVCRHRAGPLATEEARGAAALVCKYHGWTYGLDGRLRGAPEMGRAREFDASAICLPQARVAEWRGLVFAALDEAARPAEIAALTGAADAVIDRDAPPTGGFGAFTFDHRVTYDVACNWKVYVDNYLEGYHVRHVHPALDRLLDGPNYTTTIGAWHALQASPLLTPAASQDALYGNGAARYWWLYPNTMLNVLPGRLQTNRVMPLAAGKCRVEFLYFYDADVRADRRVEDQRFSDVVQHEDIGICEAVQRGLASGSYVAGRLNPIHEAGLWHFHELLRTAYRASHHAN